MPVYSRQVGTVSSLVTVFLPDRTVSTGAGLANIVASTVRLTWLRSDMAAVSSWTLTTGTLGTWTGSTMTQVGSTSTLGAYQFSLPNGLFASGDNAYAHIMSSTAVFAEVPLFIELTKTDNQTYLSSQTVGFVRNNVSVSTATIPFGVSSISTPVTASTAGVTSITIPVGVSSITTPVTASSVSATVGVSTVTIPLGISTATAGVNEAVADALLLRNVSSGVNTGRLVREALYAIRNRVDLTNGVVYATDDTTSSWAFNTTTSVVNPVTEIDPIG